MSSPSIAVSEHIPDLFPLCFGVQLEWKWGSDADFRSRVLAKLGSYKDEEERKAKISRANAGRIPWNAGRAHSPGGWCTPQ